MYIIRIIELASKQKGELTLRERFGEYIFFEDVDYATDIGEVKLTPFLQEAMKFKTPVEALNKYREVNPNRPTREDGKANRPITAFTIEVAKEEYIEKEWALNATDVFKDFGLNV
jgi:hypothetical protein